MTHTIFSYGGANGWTASTADRMSSVSTTQAAAVAPIGQAEVDRLIAEHEALRAARRAPAPKTASRGRYVTGYGRRNNNNPFPGMLGFGETL